MRLTAKPLGWASLGCTGVLLAALPPHKLTSTVVILFQFSLRLATLCPARLWPSSWGAPSTCALYSWVLTACYCIAAIVRSIWDPACLDVLIPRPTSPYFQSHPYEMFFIANAVDQVMLRNVCPAPALLWMSVLTAAANIYVAWVRQQYGDTSLLQYVLGGVVWNGIAPWMTGRLFNKVLGILGQQLQARPAILSASSSAAPASAALAASPTAGQAAAFSIKAKQVQGSQAAGASSAAPAAAVGSGEKVLKASRYFKRRPDHKVCIKLDTDLWYDQLPYTTLAKRVQGALHTLAGPQLHLTAMAARAGCVMVTLSLTEGTGRQGHAHAGSSMSGADASAPPTAMGPEALADALMSQLLQLVGSSNTAAAAADGAAAVRKVQVQVDDWLAEAHAPQHGGSSSSSSSNSWQLQPVQAGQLASSADSAALLSLRSSSSLSASSGSLDAAPEVMPCSRPWLGVAGVLAGPQPAGPEAEVLLALTVEVQLWGLGKLDAVEGWEAPSRGQHVPWPAPCTAAATGQQASPLDTSQGRELRLLARTFGGGYLTTCVQRVVTSRAGRGGAATVQVLLSLPASQLVVHHAGGAPSQVLLLSLELWERELLLSSSPLLAATPPTPTPAATGAAAVADAAVAAGYMPSWWWGASEAAVAAALSDVHACGQALAASGEEAAEVLPSHLAFMSDLAHWLAGVKRCALTTPRLCAMVAHEDGAGRCAGLGLPPAELQQLGEELAAHAGHIGLQGVQHMVQQQMRHVVLPAMKQRQQQGRPAQQGQLLGVLQGCQEVVAGFRCQLCEHAYKQQLSLRLSRLQAVSSMCTALYALVAAVYAAAMGDGALVMLVSGPWVCLHLAGVLVRVLKPSSPPKTSLRWPAAAYVWRASTRLLMEIGLLPRLSICCHFCRTIRTWPLTHLMFAATEQMQASAVLPAPWVLAVSALLDLPTILICTWTQATGQVFLLSAVLAPAVILGARLALDGVLRHYWLRSGAGPAGSRAASSTTNLRANMAGPDPGAWHDKIE